METKPTIWFCSDHHFFHNKEFIYKPRCENSVEEMNESIIKMHNFFVKPEDTVYMLGDVGLNGTPEEILDCVRKLNGKKYLCIGNHDSDKRLEVYAASGLFEDIQMAYRIKYKKKTFILSHYPTIVSNFEEDKPIYNIHGHLHSKELFHENLPGCIQISMEQNYCIPISIDEIILKITTYKTRRAIAKSEDTV